MKFPLWTPKWIHRIRHFFAYLKRYWTHYHLLAIAKDAPYHEGKLFKIEAWYLIKKDVLHSGPFIMLDAEKIPFYTYETLPAGHKKAVLECWNMAGWDLAESVKTTKPAVKK